jgi:DNA end-binding protein Ku
MRNKEYPVAIRPDDEVLKLETMYFSDEIRSPSEDFPELPGADEVTDRELQMANLLLESMESDWDPEKYQDTHRIELEAIIEAKRQGNEIVIGTEAEPASTKVVDLMQVLSASVESIKAAGQPAKKPAARTTKRAAAPATKKRAAPKRPTPIKATAKAAKPKATARRKAS